MAAPAPYPRATRSAGQQTRRALLDAAAPLFAERGLAGVSAAEIARAAGAFPSQVTYYFGSKEALFVEAACRGALYAARDVERAGIRTRTPRTYIRKVAEVALASPALLNFAEAALLVRHRPELAPPVRAAFARLHTEAERAVTEQLVARGWQVTAAHGSSFWAAVFGIVLERAATGDAFDPASAETSLQLILNLYTDLDARS